MLHCILLPGGVHVRSHDPLVLRVHLVGRAQHDPERPHFKTGTHLMVNARKGREPVPWVGLKKPPYQRKGGELHACVAVSGRPMCVWDGGMIESWGGRGHQRHTHLHQLNVL
jgi:hypothetical protein